MRQAINMSAPLLSDALSTRPFPTITIAWIPALASTIAWIPALATIAVVHMPRRAASPETHRRTQWTRYRGSPALWVVMKEAPWRGTRRRRSAMATFASTGGAVCHAGIRRRLTMFHAQHPALERCTVQLDHTALGIRHVLKLHVCPTGMTVNVADRAKAIHPLVKVPTSEICRQPRDVYESLAFTASTRGWRTPVASGTTLPAPLRMPSIPPR
mmetsp:Transcript_49285/g.82693  ORF Transcript_49285/g.82693 Transcript_49285/m.82693 type:complete len:214 (+) Transcript_49285:962-1603(+)